jgi:hypothetical protein
MRNEYLDQDQGGGITGALGSIYGWSTLEMLNSFTKKGGGHYGEYYIPWSGLARINRNKPFAPLKPFAFSARNKAFGVTEEMLGANIFQASSRAGKGLVRGAWGTAAGYGQVALSRAAGIGVTTMAFSDPIWYAFEFGLNPATWWWSIPVGAAWFGVRPILMNAAKQAERNRYVNMGGYFPETQASFTSRQRSVRAISESNLQARSAIGQEAQLFHR